jgi:hypothetical protein
MATVAVTGLVWLRGLAAGFGKQAASGGNLRRGQALHFLHEFRRWNRPLFLQGPHEELARRMDRLLAHGHTVAHKSDSRFDARGGVLVGAMDDVLDI